MDLKQLAVLRAIADTGSFNAAASQLGLTQPAISHQIRRLEEELGETLILRSRPRAALSPAGAAVLDAAHRIFGEIEELKQSFAHEDAKDISGVLRVTASNLGIIYLYGDLLERFIAEHPRIEVVFTATETPFDGVRQVLARGADAAFVAFPVDEPALNEVVLGETEHVVIVGRSHPLARQRDIGVADLRRYPFIRYKLGAGSRVVSDALFLKRGGYPEIFLESNDTEFVKRIVGLGYASAITPRFVVTSERRDRRLKSLKAVGGVGVQKYGLVFRRDTRMRALNVFTAFCVAHKAMVPS